jgi:hypothetical protein
LGHFQECLRLVALVIVVISPMLVHSRHPVSMRGHRIARNFMRFFQANFDTIVEIR